jgi:hypothetical protein
MTSPELFVEELAGVYESGPIVKVHLASVVPGPTQAERAIVCRLVGTVADMRQIAARILDALAVEGESAPPAKPAREAAPDEVVIGVVS